ncbi:nephrin-like [Artemia franciscana]|uniref:nephrin-like n=1 Tax=Artemia franciscana TaxID=6661 RepID=UPI0032D9C68D
MEIRIKKVRQFSIVMITLVYTNWCLDINKPDPIFDAFAIAGTTVKLPCSPAQQAQLKPQLILWYKEPHKTPFLSLNIDSLKNGATEELNKPRFMIDSSNTFPGDLYVFNASENDSGIYRCRLDYAKDPTIHIRHNMTVIDPPRQPILSFESQIHTAKSIFIEENGSLTMTCEASGGPSAVQVIWLKNGEVLDSVMEVDNFNVRVNTLHIGYLSRDYDGLVLECRVVMLHDIIVGRRRIQLNLYLSPLEIEVEANVTSFQANKGYNISCTVKGSYPAPNISWWTGADQVLETFYQVLDSTKLSVSTIVLYPTPYDNGKMLTCRAINPNVPVAVIEDSLKLHVTYKPITILTLGQSFDISNIKEGDDIFLDCFVRANPPFHRLQWSLNGSTLNHSVQHGVIMSNQSLVLRNLTKLYTGSYVCSALNNEGEGVSNEFEIRVQYIPLCSVTNTVTVTVAGGDLVNLTCTAEAFPDQLSFNWSLSPLGQDSRSGRTSIPGATVVVDGRTSILTYRPIDVLSDYGIVFCLASNKMGNMKRPCAFNVTKEGIPNSPSGCLLLNPANKILKVICSDKNLPPNTTFYLELYEIETMKLIYNKTNTVPHFIVPGITPETKVSAGMLD